MKKKVLTVLYNILSGHFSTTRTEILSCFPCEDHKEVHEAIEALKKDGILYSQSMRYDTGQFAGVQHYIDWEKFEDGMIDQSLVS